MMTGGGYLPFLLCLSVGGRVNSSNLSTSPVTLHLLGLPKRGTYVVKEEIEKAPVHDHPCNLTETAVKIAFPEMESEVFMSLLGYKGSNMIHLQRCKGRCVGSDSTVSCTATRVREKKVKMAVRSFLTGGEHRERLKELILDDHTECGCECDPHLSRECAGQFNKVSCHCECPAWEYGEKKIVCEMRRDYYWDSGVCKCVSKTVSPRGLDHDQDYFKKRCAPDSDHQLEMIKLLSSDDIRGLDMLAWVLLGSSLTLVILLAGATGYYRRQLRTAMVEDTDTRRILQEEVDNEGSKGTAKHFSYAGASDSTDSMEPTFSCEEVHEEGVLNFAKKLRRTRVSSTGHGFPGLQGATQVEIGGEFYYQPFATTTTTTTEGAADCYS